MKRLLLCLALCLAASPMRALAGPPFDTDDPDPTQYRNYEIYAGATTHRDTATSTSELAFLEINYGLMPNVQFSVHAGTAESTAFAQPNGYGFEDFEMGLKTRFIQESEHSPQVSIYPQVTFATGASAVGEGHGTFFLPIWAQKTIGKVTVFGGGGWEFDRDDTGNGDWQAGLAATYPLTADDTIGMEVTRTTPHDDYSQSDIGVGYIHMLGAYHALLFSLGRSYGQQPHYRGYVAYGWFLGPAHNSGR
ncbi:MAG TPA: hypothetical protein VMB20_10885 [Candidatus Acidoferrum sp.]|nr:hypothetical protein [Candidatus Acidoferrum sp.]